MNNRSHSRRCPVNNVGRGTREMSTTSNPSEASSCLGQGQHRMRKSERDEKVVPLSRIPSMGNTKDPSRWGRTPSCATPNAAQSERLYVYYETRFRAERRLISPMQLPHPPNSAAKSPPGFRTFLTPRMTPAGSRLHQCRTALLNTLSNCPCLANSSDTSSSSSAWMSWT